jgi:protein gp37
MARRFGWDFAPHWVEKNYITPMPRKPSFIFVGSMSDPEYWEPEWYPRVVRRIIAYPQHTFLLLTKNAAAYRSPMGLPENLWLGVTATDNTAMLHLGPIGNIGNLVPTKQKSFLSFEPLLEEIMELSPIALVDWVIVGAETGNRKGRVKPRPEWVKRIVDAALEYGKPIWLKNNLKPYYHGKWYQQRPEVR